MKYSQAILVACVGGAAFVAGIPTPPKPNTGSDNAVTAPKLGDTVDSNGGHGPGKALEGQHLAVSSSTADSPSHTASPSIEGSKGKMSDAQRKRLMEKWSKMTPEQKARYKQGAERWSKMTPEQKARYKQWAEKWSKMTPEEKAKYREARQAKLDKLAKMTPAEKERQKSAKKPGNGERSATSTTPTTPNTGSGHSTSPPTVDAAKATRNFEEDVFERGFEDELTARGLGSAFRAVRDTLRGYRAPSGNAISSPTDPTMTQRDFSEDDILGMRDLEHLSARELDSILSPRDIEEELVTRTLGDAFKALENTLGLSKHVKPAKPVKPVKPIQPTESLQSVEDPDMVEREIFEDDVLAMRDLEGIPSAREFDDTLSSREIEEDFAARGLGSAFRAVKSRFRGPAPSSTESDASVTRRDLVDSGEGALYMRALDEILDSRDFEESIAARGLGSAFRAVRDTLRGYRKPTGDSINSAESTMVQRDVLEINELD